jgi:hypothetical protein
MGSRYNNLTNQKGKRVSQPWNVVLQEPRGTHMGARSMICAGILDRSIRKLDIKLEKCGKNAVGMVAGRVRGMDTDRSDLSL